MTDSQLGRARDFMREAVRRQAPQIIEMSYGFAVLDGRFPHSYDHNKLVLTAPVDPAEAVSDADRILGGAGLTHRLISIHGSIEPAWVDVCVAAGYQHSAELIMVQTGAEADRPADQQIPVEAVGVDALRESGRREWRDQLPDAGDDVIEELVGRRVTRLEAAPQVAFLAVRDGTGQIVSRADLYLNPTEGVAQIEDVLTLSAHTGRGYARAIMAEGLQRAQAAGCDLIFVVADADDWPRQLYTRLGYAGIGDGHSFVRPPAP
jgi:GNAT superfamily N-acetyltransferase